MNWNTSIMVAFCFCATVEMGCSMQKDTLTTESNKGSGSSIVKEHSHDEINGLYAEANEIWRSCCLQGRQGQKDKERIKLLAARLRNIVTYISPNWRPYPNSGFGANYANSSFSNVKGKLTAFEHCAENPARRTAIINILADRAERGLQSLEVYCKAKDEWIRNMSDRSSASDPFRAEPASSADGLTSPPADIVGHIRPARAGDLLPTMLLLPLLPFQPSLSQLPPPPPAPSRTQGQLPPPPPPMELPLPQSQPESLLSRPQPLLPPPSWLQRRPPPPPSQLRRVLHLQEVGKRVNEEILKWKNQGLPMEVYPVDYLAWFEKTCEDLDLTTIDYSVDNRCPFSRGEYARIRGTVEGLIQVLRDLAKK